MILPDVDKNDKLIGSSEPLTSVGMVIGVLHLPYFEVGIRTLIVHAL